jgi:predicted metalloprotease with PDZ domain
MILLLLLLFATTMSVAQNPTVRYTLSMPNPSSHLLEVEFALDGLPEGGAGIDLLLPVWRPGRYQVLDLASGVVSFSVTDADGHALAWSKTEKSRWHVERGAARSVRARYTVYANEFSLRTRGLNDEHAFVDGAAAFLYAEEYRALPVELEVRPYKDWHVTTGLEGGGTRFHAPDYDTFIDCPLEIGTQADIPFEVEGVPHVLSIAGSGNYDTAVLVRDITKIVETTKAMWGSFPYRRYVFLVHCSPTSGGGTEHVNSTIMGTRPYIFKNPESYRSFLSLVAHEYFHTWNVKQLRPKGITPYDYTRENYTGELWVSEGTTSYYDELLLVRAGLATPEKYLEVVQAAVMGDRARPGNTVQPLSSSSFDAWIKYTKMNQQAYNTESDFYDKGSSVSLLLDLEIRQASANARSLDDVLRSLALRFPLGAGFDQTDLLRACTEAAGKEMAPFFASYVDGTEPLPWERVLGYAGIELVRKDSVARPWIGLASSDADGRTRVTRVVAGSPAAAAGIDPGDEIVALNGVRARTADVTDRVAELKPGDRVRLTLFRNDQLREAVLTVGTQPVPALAARRVASPSEMQRAIYQGWLRADWK